MEWILSRPYRMIYLEVSKLWRKPTPTTLFTTPLEVKLIKFHIMSVNITVHRQHLQPVIGWCELLEELVTRIYFEIGHISKSQLMGAAKPCRTDPRRLYYLKRWSNEHVPYHPLDLEGWCSCQQRSLCCPFLSENWHKPIPIQHFLSNGRPERQFGWQPYRVLF